MPNFRNQVQDTIAANGASVRLDGWRECVNGGVGVQVTGTFVGTLQVQVTIDGTNWAALVVRPVSTESPTTAITAPSLVSANVIGVINVRVVATAWTSGTATVTIAALAG